MSRGDRIAIVERKSLMCSIRSKFETRKAKLCCHPGFTLLEVLVSLSIIAIAVTVVLQLFSVDLRTISASEDYVSAVTKAEAKMREVLDNEFLSETSWSEATPDGYRMDVYVSDVLKDRTANLQVRLLEASAPPLRSAAL